MTDSSRLALIPLVLALAACGKAPPPVTVTPTVWVTTVRNQMAEQDRVFTATVEPRVATPVAFRTGGKVVARLVDIGQTVEAGQVLARLDPADRLLEVAAAHEQVKAAQAASEQAVSDEQRLGRLKSDGSVGTADHERQQARAKAAQAQLAQAQAQLELARNRAGHVLLQAPYAGVLTQWQAEPGQVVSEGQVVGMLARAGDVEVQADVPEQLAAGLGSWQAQLLWRQGAQTHRASLTLREVSPVSSPAGRTVRVRYALSGATPAQRASLRWGQSAELNVSAPASARSALLPTGALVKTDGQPAVWVAQARTGRLLRQAVDVQGYEREAVRVAGLPDGLQVVSVGAQKLTADMSVRVVERPVEVAP